MLIQYDSIHKKDVDDAIAMVELQMPDQFNYFFFADETTGSDRLEITVFAGQSELEGTMAGTLVHSKL